MRITLFSKNGEALNSFLAGCKHEDSLSLALGAIPAPFILTENTSSAQRLLASINQLKTGSLSPANVPTLADKGITSVEDAVAFIQETFPDTLTWDAAADSFEAFLMQHPEYEKDFKNRGAELEKTSRRLVSLLDWLTITWHRIRLTPASDWESLTILNLFFKPLQEDQHSIQGILTRRGSNIEFTHQHDSQLTQIITDVRALLMYITKAYPDIEATLFHDTEVDDWEEGTTITFKKGVEVIQ